MKPKEFLLKQRGSCYKRVGERDFKNSKAGMIYLSNTQLRIIFRKGGEHIIPLNTIKKLNLYKARGLFGEKARQRISIQTDTDETYAFFTTNLQKLYKLLSEVTANLSDGRDVQIGPKQSNFPWGLLIWLIIVITGIMLIFLWPPFIKILEFFRIT